MKIETIKSVVIDDEYVRAVHSSGLNVYIYPKKGFSSTYAIFGTNYGSINTKFKTGGSNDIIVSPDGIAHYLEHKMFESEDGDAFFKYAKTGASANAYTSFDKTCYLFSCSENFYESLKILMDLVQTAYFTEQTVQKEQGIIAQEIKMYEDEPEWRVMFNLLGALYHNHPVRVDIAGTVESIAQITDKKLYQCYNSFYNLSNMAICIVGDVDVNKTLDFIEENLKDEQKVDTETIFPNEPETVFKDRVEQHFEISAPIFQLGFKEKVGESRLSTKDIALTDILLECMASKISPLYKELLKRELINTSSFSYEYFEGPGYASIIFAGESKDPDLAAKLIKEESIRIHKEGIDKEIFEIAKKAVYGKTIAALNKTGDIANNLISFHFSSRELFEYIDEIANAKLGDVLKRLENELIAENSALSVVSPIKGSNEEK